MSGRRARQRPLGGVALRQRGSHGLSVELIALMVERQGGRCPVCERPISSGSSVVDHDHALAERDGHAPERGCPRCVRAVLCRECNLVLGNARDDPRVLSRAAAYLVAAREALKKKSPLWLPGDE